MNKIWLERSSMQNNLDDLAKSLDLPLILLKALAARDIHNEIEAKNYLSPSLAKLTNPFLFAGMKKGALAVIEAILNQEMIGIFGDYDVDGVCSAAILKQFLLSLHAKVKAILPNRLRDGYGLNKEAIRQLADAGAKIIITVDCGILAHDPIDYANSLGLSVIVIDHHELGSSLPNALAVINPKRQDCASKAYYLCAAGVTFFFALAIRSILREQGYFSQNHEPDLKNMLDLVSLATICDVVPLIKDNRILVKAGLGILKQGRRIGLKALLDSCDLLPHKITATVLGFHLGPKINAAGRLEDPNLALSLLTTNDYNLAYDLAHQLHEANNMRKELEISTVNEAIDLIDKHNLKENRFLVLYNEKWHPGVVGIVAGRIAEKYHLPTIIIAKGGKGSGRSIKGVDLHHAVSQAASTLLGFGGHAHAIGLTLGPLGIDPFIKDLALAMRDIDPEIFIPKLYYDSVIGMKDIDLSLLDNIEKLSPFGAHNPSIIFRINNCLLHNIKRLNQGHIKGDLIDQYGRISFIGFRMDIPDVDISRHLDVLAIAEKNDWQGIKSIQLRLIDYQFAV